MEVSTQVRGEVSSVEPAVRAGIWYGACCDTPSGAMTSNVFKLNSRPFVNGELATPGRNAAVEQAHVLSNSE